MGASGSKTARSAAGAASRKFPARPAAGVSRSNNPQHGSNAPETAAPPGGREAPGPTVRPQARASGERNEDAADPDFAASLRSLGAVQPNPTFSPSSTATPYSHSNNQPASSPTSVFPDPATNPAITLLKARDDLAQAAEREFLEAGRRGHAGREFLDVVTLQQALNLRDGKGVQPGEIERRLGLKPGVVQRLGKVGVVGSTGV
ncbi:MAG: hypothetical protein M1819_003011 [Sarea resinae]|nr:MAG: hypothetical protein M1819_003011 [Sarea resinae]